MLSHTRIFLLLMGAVLAAPKQVSEAEALSMLDDLTEEHVAIFGQDVSATFIEDLSGKLAGLIDFLQLSESSTQLPDDGFRLYPIGPKIPGETLTKDFSEAGFQLDDLINFLDEKLDAKLEMVNAEYISTYISFKISSDRKMTWVLFDGSMTKKNLALRTLASIPRFGQKFAFVKAFGKFDNIKKQLNLEKFPALVGFYPTGKLTGPDSQDNVSAFKHSGSLGFAPLKKFFELAITEQFQKDFLKGFNMPKDDADFPEVPGKTGYNDTIVIQSLDEAGLEVLSGCDKIVCLLALAKYESEGGQPAESLINTLKEVQRTVSRASLKVVVIEGTCHHYLLQQLGFGEESLPVAAAYNPRTLEYIPYKGTFDIKGLNHFIMNLTSKEFAPVKLEDKLVLRPGPCHAKAAEPTDGHGGAKADPQASSVRGDL